MSTRCVRSSVLYCKALAICLAAEPFESRHPLHGRSSPHCPEAPPIRSFMPQPTVYPITTSNEKVPGRSSVGELRLGKCSGSNVQPLTVARLFCPLPSDASPQIMIVDASDMLADFVAVVTAVAEFSGLPAHTFKYNPSREHKTGCLARDQKFHNNYFVDGGRFVNKFTGSLRVILVLVNSGNLEPPHSWVGSVCCVGEVGNA